jgi:allantoicase
MFDNAEAATHESDAWQTLLSEAKLDMDKQHFFEDEVQAIGTVSHVRLSIYPDGGVSRLRLHGRIDLRG